MRIPGYFELMLFVSAATDTLKKASGTAESGEELETLTVCFENACVTLSKAD